VRRVVLPLLMLVAMLPSAAFARVAYLCSMDRKVRSACCCPKQPKQDRNAVPVSTLARAGCCELSAGTPVKTDAVDPPRTDVPQPELVAIAAPPPAAPAVRRELSFAPRAHAPPDTPAHSLFASHCALLL